VTSVIYCDSDSDEMAARLFLLKGPLTGFRIQRLPSLAQAPDFLKPLLTWERLDWVVVIDGEIRCTVELSRHGYTGDHGFQRFARLFRSASLGIPTIYFTPFARTRINELDEGQSSPRNVAPELFSTLIELEDDFGVACLAVNWPVRADDGQPATLQDPVTRPVMERLAELVGRVATEPPTRSPQLVSEEFPELAMAMNEHARIGYRGGDTRGAIDLPIAIGSPTWIYDFLPDEYFRIGKGEKVLASLALDSCASRPVVGDGDPSTWSNPGQAWTQYLGYQWRPDPACGLIALSATKARARNIPLIIVWPRVFASADGKRTEMLEALREFKVSGAGPLGDEMRKHGRAPKIAAFSDRVSDRSNQFGVFTAASKIGRVLADTSDALVLGDKVLTFKR
jgi:hypothetical protein